MQKGTLKLLDETGKECLSLELKNIHWTMDRQAYQCSNTGDFNARDLVASPKTNFLLTGTRYSEEDAEKLKMAYAKYDKVEPI